MTLRLLVIALALTLAQGAVKAEEEKPRFAANSEIYLFDLAHENGAYKASNGRNISNNDDYDSQPFFLPGNKALVFASARDGKQTDVYRYDIDTNKLSQVTSSPHSEFSPKPVGDTGRISYVSEGNNPYNTVWQLDPKTGEETWLFNSKEPVGYYQFDEPSGDVLFWSRYGWSVQYLNVKQNANRFVSGHAIPSTPQKVPDSHRFSFVHRQTNGMVWIKAFDPKPFSITPIAPIFGDNYEYTWAPNGDILRFNDGKLSVWPKDNKSFGWVDGQDLGKNIKGKLARLTVSDNGKYLALVATQ